MSLAQRWDAGAKLLEQFGEKLTFSRQVKGAYNPETGGYLADTTETFTAGCFFTAFDGEIDGSLIQAGDSKVLIDAVGTAPQPGDTLDKRGVVYRVLQVRADEVGGDAVIYTAQVRK